MTSSAWKTEPNHVDFTYKGYPCIIHRVDHHGALCGYVGVPKGHPYFGLHYNDINDVDVHGGLSYSAECFGDICHKNADGSEPDERWWLGFDCAHSFDLIPEMSKLFGLECTYRDIPYVTKELESLVDQLQAVETPNV
jgi:hypothetical protein